ncbi:MAG: hydrogenase iron-sulfur subunit [bacterium]
MAKTPAKTAVLIVDSDGHMAQGIDTGKLTEKLSSGKDVVFCRILKYPLPESQAEQIKQELTEGICDRILWIGHFTGTQKRSLTETFVPAGLNPFLHGWCDLLDQGVLSASQDRALMEKKALTVIRMALARTRLLEALEPMELPASKSVLIVGAGVAGLNAAETLSQLGHKVHLVEQKSGVGGKVALLSRFYPRMCDPHCGIEVVLNALSASERVDIHTLTRVVETTGSPGNYTIRLEKAPRYVKTDLCTACGECLNVCPVEFANGRGAIQDMPPFNTGNGLLKLLPGKTRAIHPAEPFPFPEAFVIERDRCPAGCQECEKVCPTGAIDLQDGSVSETVEAGAILVATGWDPFPLSQVTEYGYGVNPGVIGNLEMEQLLATFRVPHAPLSTFDLNKTEAVGFVQCAGSRDDRYLKYCSTVCCSGTLKQVMTLKQAYPDIRCYIFYNDIRSTGFDENLLRTVKMLDGVVFIPGFPAQVETNRATGKLSAVAEDTLSGREIKLELDLLVLAGGMQPSQSADQIATTLGLPRNQYGFFESHHQCRPEESQRTGIFVGGCAREPMNVAHSLESIHLAAMKALRFTMGTVRVEPAYPVVDKTKCDQCKRCVEDCPFSCFYYDEKGFPVPDLAKCRQCGNCMGVCPVIAISKRDCTIRQLSQQVETMGNSPFLDYEEPIILSFLCENDAAPAVRLAMEQGIPVPPNVISIPVPCAGAVNNALLADALSLGIDGVLIAGCKEGHCHYVNGDQLVRKRSGDLKDKLETMMIEQERVRFVSLEIRDALKYADTVAAYVADLKAIGPNPFKV